MARRAKGFAAARRVTIKRSAVNRAADAVLWAIPRAVAHGAVGSIFGLGAPAAVVSVAQSAIKIYRANSSFNSAGTMAAATSAGVARMDAARAVMANRPTATSARGQVRVASARLSLARAAAVRTAVQMRTSNVLGMRARAAAQKAGSDGRVDTYTRVQNGRSVQVQGYSRR